MPDILKQFMEGIATEVNRKRFVDHQLFSPPDDASLWHLSMDGHHDVSRDDLLKVYLLMEEIQDHVVLRKAAGDDVGCQVGPLVAAFCPVALQQAHWLNDWALKEGIYAKSP